MSKSSAEMFFEFSPVRANKKTDVVKPKTVSDEIEILSLAPFTPLPKLFFENIKIGEATSRKLLIKNSTTQDVYLHVNLNNIPRELSVSVNWETKYFEKGKEEIFEICWCPSSIESSRYVITFEDYKRIKRDVPVIFKTDVSFIKKKGNQTAKQPKHNIPIKPKTRKSILKPSKISPKRYPKAIPTVNVFSSPSLLQQTYSNEQIHKRDKENVPTTLVQNSSIFLSPKNFSFRLNTNEEEIRRETYVFDKEIQNLQLMETATVERRETFILHGKCVEGHPTFFRDSLAVSTPIVSPNKNNDTMTYSTGVFSNRIPLSTHNRTNTNDGSINSSPTHVISDFEYKMNRLQTFCFSPLDTSNTITNCLAKDRRTNISPIGEDNTFDIHSTRAMDSMNEICMENNISGGTYVKDNSFETYVKGNLSSETYTKDEPACLTSNISLSPYSDNRKPETLEYQREFQKTSLSCIVEEESFISKSYRHHNTPDCGMFKKPLFKRKLDIDYVYSPPKKPNITNSIKDWSKRGGSNAIRIAKHSSGLNVTNLKKTINTDSSKEAFVEFAKTDTNNVIIQNPFLLAATNSIDPFIARHLTVSEEWIEQQENNFKNWLNVLLTPPKDLASDEQTINVAKIWQQSRNREVEVAPSKEMISNKYHTNNRLNCLRKAARDFYRTEDFCVVLANVYNAVDQGKLSIREDKDLRSNIALRAGITSNLLSYNPLWLRIGLETIYNDVIPLTSNSDVIGLSHFIGNRMLKDPYLLKKYKSVHAPNYVKDFNKSFLKKYFSLVYFLDKAKNIKLIGHDPCLFCKKGTVKESKELLLRLARETLSAVGDITKYLKYLKYNVTHVQTYIHEFDYGVKNLGADLRDGVRLTRIMEVILMTQELTGALRVPAISRLQKVHNMKIVFDALAKAGYTIMYDISAKDIVDGHREKTLSFLWQIIYKFETPFVRKSATTIQTWFRSLPVVLKRRMLEKKRLRKETAANTIRNWYLRHKLAENLIFFAKSLKFYMDFMKRERAAVTIQKNFIQYVCRKRYVQLKQMIIKIQSRCRGWLIRTKKIYNIRSIITIQSYVRMFVQRRSFLKLKMSAILIQRRFRAIKAMRIDRAHYLKMNKSVVFLQRKYRANRSTSKVKEAYRALKTATVCLQRRYRGNKLCRIQRDKYLKVNGAIVTVQRWYRAKTARRSYLLLKQSVTTLEKYYSALRLMRTQRYIYQELRSAALTIQRQYRAIIEMRIQRNHYQKLKACTILVQQKFRAKKQMELERTRYQILRMTTIFIQRQFRANLLMKNNQKVYNETRCAVIKIQRWYRASKEMKMYRDHYLALKYAVQIVEQKYEARILMNRDRQIFMQTKSAAIAIQRKYRAQIAMRSCRTTYIELRLRCSLVQNIFRVNRLSKIQRSEYLQLRNSTIALQRRFRARSAMLRCRQCFQRLKLATIYVQRTLRANWLMREQKSVYQQLRKCTINMQRRYRAQRSMLKAKTDFDRLRASTIIVQRRWRARKLCITQRKVFLAVKCNVVFLQQHWRANKLAKRERNSYEMLKKSVVFVQRRWRANRLRNIDLAYFNRLKRSVKFVQHRWRANKSRDVQRQFYQELRKSATIIQQRWRGNKLAKHERNNYELLKKSVVFVQRYWRANRLRNIDLAYFNRLKRSVKFVQQRWRANKSRGVQRQFYQELRKSATIIQQRWRGNKLAKHERNNYELLKKSVIFVQRRWRANRLRNIEFAYYNSLKRYVTFVQQRWRANKSRDVQRKFYQELRKSTRIIQQRWRANKIGRFEKCCYLRLKNAVLLIQRKWRADKQRDHAVESYSILKKVTINIQQLWRANKRCYEHRCYYQTLKMTVITIQRKWRLKKLMQKNRQEYIKMRNGIIQLQSLWRGARVRREFLRIKQVIISTQRKWRCKRLMMTELKKFTLLKHYTVVIQRRFRANRLMKKEWTHFMELKKSATVIQTFYRGHKQMQQLRSSYQNTKRIVVKLQTVVRGYLIRRKYEHFLSIEARNQRKMERKWNTAAIKIQAVWKGYKCRKSSIPACEKIYNRLKQVNEHVHPEKTLQFRATQALRAFTTDRPTLFGIIKALEELVYITRHSREICEGMGNILPDQLYVLLRATSRSLPEMNACILSVNILITFCKLPSTRAYSFVPEYMDNLIQVMLHWCDKESVLFPHTCTLLWLFAHEPKRKNCIKSLANLEQRFHKIRTLVLRKQSMVKKAGVKGSSMFATYKDLPLPNLRPDAGFVSDNTAPNTFGNSVQAMLELSKILEI